MSDDEDIFRRAAQRGTPRGARAVLDAARAQDRSRRAATDPRPPAAVLDDEPSTTR